MKDYSKVKYVKPSVDGVYITKGKVYECLNKGYSSRFGYTYTYDNNGFKHYICIDNIIWHPCDEKGKEIEL